MEVNTASIFQVDDGGTTLNRRVLLLRDLTASHSRRQRYDKANVSVAIRSNNAQTQKFEMSLVLFCFVRCI